jgi:hypothetical protein
MHDESRRQAGLIHHEHIYASIDVRLKVRQKTYADALLARDAGKAVSDAGVTQDSAGLDEGVRILCLDDELDSLDGSGRGLGDGSGDTFTSVGNVEFEISLDLIIPSLLSRGISAYRI